MARQSLDPLVLIAEKMTRYTNVGFNRTMNGCEISPPNDGGFKIELLEDDEGWVVYFGEAGTHEHFTNPADALEFVGFGLSNSCRLREVRMPFLQRNYVEQKNGNSWDIILEFGFLRSPFPIKTAQSIFQNKLIED